MTAKNKDYPIENIPLDGSMRMMEKTSLLEYVWFGYGASKVRKVYRHKPTGKLYYVFDNRWYGTFPEYCYDTVTHEKGSLCTIHYC